MSELNIFEFATRGKVRFPFKGQVSVEDLWDLSLKDLDSIYKTLSIKKRDMCEESIFETETSDNSILDKQIEIVKYIAGVKIAEKEIVEKRAEEKKKEQFILAAIERKEKQEIAELSIEELNEMLKNLNK